MTDGFVDVTEDVLTEDDISGNATLQSPERVASLVSRIEPESVDSVLDLGCGRGGAALAIGQHFGADELYGVDADPDCRARAEERGVKVYDVDLESEPVPLNDSSVDVVVSFGLLEHLRYYDNPVSEANRVLRDEGWLLVSVPNLGSWVNRLTLLFGNQPRNIEFSRHRAFGVSKRYKSGKLVHHVHAPTYGALVELLEFHGFEVVDSTGLFPYQRGRVVRLVDAVTKHRTSLCRRVAVLARKEGASEVR